jgi:hypothetical protein
MTRVPLRYSGLSPPTSFLRIRASGAGHGKPSMGQSGYRSNRVVNAAPRRDGATTASRLRADERDPTTLQKPPYRRVCFETDRPLIGVIGGIALAG